MKSPSAGFNKPTTSTQSFKAQLVPCVDEFTWETYLDACGTQPALGDSLFLHHKFANSTLCEVLLKTGTTVFIQKVGQLNPKQAIIETTVINKVFVRYTDNNEREFVELNEILEESVARCLLRKRDLNLARFSHEHLHLMGEKMKDLIEIGEYFELQDEQDPRVVSIVKVLQNHSGLIFYGIEEKEEPIGCIHMANERCHAVGWGQQREQAGIAYHQNDQILLEKAHEKPVNQLIFEHNPVLRHTVKLGQMVEVVDSFGNGLIYPGYISAILNDYYFRVAVCTEDIDSDYELTAHSAHPFIFQAGWSKVNGLRLSTPEGFAPIGSGLPKEFNWISFQKMYQLLEPIDEDAISHPIVKELPEAMRHLEVLNQQNGILGTATIVRAIRHLLWLTFDHSPVQQPPSIFAVNSEQIFPCNFARDHNLPFLNPPSFRSLPALKDGEIRFGKDKLFTHVLTTVFQPPKQPYLPECYIKYDYFLPTVYFNHHCYVGPFLRADRVALLQKQYGPGTMIKIIKLIFRDLFGCFYYVNDFFKLFEWGERTSLPTLYAKKERRKNRQSELGKVLHIPRCESARTFAGWMRSILRVLQACPNLISLEKIAKECCPEKCAFEEQKNKLSIPALGPVAPLPPRDVLTRSQTTEKREPKKELKRSLPARPYAQRITLSQPPLPKKARPVREVTLQKPATITRNDQQENLAALAKFPKSEDDQSSVKMSIYEPIICPSDSRKESEKMKTQIASVISPSPSTSSITNNSIHLQTNPSTWDCADLQAYLEGQGVNADVIRFLIEQELDGSTFLNLSIDIIMEKGLKFGPALVIEGEVKKLKDAIEKHFPQ
ncbi:unnamed protein product, partial [Mesorhabditis belari]|uniref:SLED domain-containing protein n=1 Tax=Mesorhabditis belari TaxID=2138241 RepID=A0AAF3EDZ7_9BILA